MKTIALSIRPESVAKILSRKKTLEPRKSLPKELPCRVLVYCAKSDDYLLDFDPLQNKEAEWAVYPKEFVEETNSHRAILNGTNTGKVVAEFTLTEAERIEGAYDELCQEFEIRDIHRLSIESCVDEDGLIDYLSKGEYNNNSDDTYGYAWHISNLEIFDKPKDLADYGLKRAPIDWCYAKEAK